MRHQAAIRSRLTTHTPLIQQYLDIKAEYPDCILFFRLGDFYETFQEDAESRGRAHDRRGAWG